MRSNEVGPAHGSEVAAKRPTLDLVGSGADCECVLGPWRGLFVAGYVTDLAGVFYGYAKVFEHRPDDPWASDALLKVGTRECPCPAEALDRAVEQGLDAIDAMVAGAQGTLWRQLLLRAAQRVAAGAAKLLTST
jgi:hypothetical protein